MRSSTLRKVLEDKLKNLMLRIKPLQEEFETTAAMLAELDKFEGKRADEAKAKLEKSSDDA